MRAKCPVRASTACSLGVSGEIEGSRRGARTSGA
jgi:hypothetical protein